MQKHQCLILRSFDAVWWQQIPVKAAIMHLSQVQMHICGRGHTTHCIGHTTHCCLTSNPEAPAAAVMQPKAPQATPFRDHSSAAAEQPEESTGSNPSLLPQLYQWGPMYFSCCGSRLCCCYIWIICPGAALSYFGCAGAFRMVSASV